MRPYISPWPEKETNESIFYHSIKFNILSLFSHKLAFMQAIHLSLSEQITSTIDNHLEWHSSGKCKSEYHISYTFQTIQHCWLASRFTDRFPSVDEMHFMKIICKLLIEHVYKRKLLEGESAEPVAVAAGRLISLVDIGQLYGDSVSVIISFWTLAPICFLSFMFHSKSKLNSSAMHGLRLTNAHSLCHRWVWR